MTGEQLPGNLRVISYNILADTYCRQFSRELYFKNPTHHLRWDSRFKLIIDEVRSLNPDVISFQEVDHYDTLEFELNRLGYHGVFLQRSGGKEDGCATFYRRDCFAISGSEHVKFCEVANLRDNVALLLNLRRIDSQQGKLPDILVASTHILFNPGRGDVKLAQVQHILNRAAVLGGSSCHLIFLGDFNSAPHSGIYDFITNGRLDIRETDRRRLGGQIEGYSCERFVSDLRQGGVQQLRYSNYFEQEAADGRDLKKLERQGWNQESLKTALGFDPARIPAKSSDSEIQSLFTVMHPFGNRLKSSIFEVTGSEPIFTTSHMGYMGTVDFVFFDSSPCGSSRLVPKSVLSCPEPLRFMSGIPSAKFGSDHISLVVDFEIQQM